MTKQKRKTERVRRQEERAQSQRAQDARELETYLLAGPRKRLDHAKGHLETLNGEIATFLKSKPQRLIREVDAQTGDHLWRIKVRQEPPLRLRLVAGDCIHNLRAALDNLAWNLARAHAEPPPARTEFPVCSSPDAFTNIAWKIEGILPAARPIIEDLQPYQRVPDAPTTDILWCLNRLWNDDKHRAPVIVNSWALGGHLSVEEAHLSGLPQINPGPVYDGKVVIRLPRPVPGANLDVEGKMTIGVAFDHEGPARGGGLIETLGQLHHFLENAVLPRFANLN